MLVLRKAFLIFALAFAPWCTFANAQGELGDELNELLASAQMEIDAIEDIIELTRKDENYTAVSINGEILLVDRREVGRALDRAARIIFTLVEIDPRAAKLVGDYLGRSLVQGIKAPISTEQSGIADLIGEFAGEVATVVVANVMSEERIRDQLQAKVDGFLESETLTDARLLDELQLRRDVYDVIDAIISEIQGDTPIQRIIDELAELGIRAVDIGDRMAEYDGECPKYYSNGFGVITNAGIPGHNKEILNNTSLSECLGECLEQDWCQSVDYERVAGTCYVQPVNSCQASLRLDYPGNPYDHYFRIPQ